MSVFNILPSFGSLGCCNAMPVLRALKKAAERYLCETGHVEKQLLGQYMFLWWSHPFLPLVWMQHWQLLGVSACCESGLQQVFFWDDVWPCYLLPSLCLASSFKSESYCWPSSWEGKRQVTEPYSDGFGSSVIHAVKSSLCFINFWFISKVLVF